MQLPEMTVEVPRIVVKRKVYDWLAAARHNPKGLAPSERRPHLEHVIATDSQLLVTTDGFRMHVYPVEGDALTPGYYDWDDRARVLVMQDAAAIGKEMYLAKNLFYPQILRGSQVADVLPLVRFHEFAFKPLDEWPALRTLGHTVVFRQAYHEGRRVAICLGLDTAPFLWGDDGQVKVAPRDTYTVVEAKFFSDALLGDVCAAAIRWNGPREPVIVGIHNGPHAVIMPLFKNGY